jgi:2'-5' RNA ligase
MRLFVAIHPPEGVLADLKKMQAELLAAQGEIRPLDGDRLGKDGVIRPQRLPWRPTRSDHLHITLQFLGNDVTIHQAEEIRQKLREVGPLFSPFELACMGAGAFPTPARAQVAYAAVESPSLMPLADGVERALALVGIRRDKAFKPHITIARSKYGQDVSRWVAGNGAKTWSGAAWAVSSFSLMESSAELGGHEHRLVEKYLLGMG